MSAHRNRLLNLAAALGVLALCFVGVVKTLGTTVSAKFMHANTGVMSEVSLGGPGDYAPPRHAPEPARVEPEVRAGQLTAGEWSDHDDWNTWIELTTGAYRSTLTFWGLGLGERITVRATSDGGPARNVSVELLDRSDTTIWAARTDGDGVAFVFADVSDVRRLRVRVANGEPIELDGREIAVKVDQPLVRDAIDLMLVVDATSSMGDELGYIQGELVDVVNRVRASTRNELDVRVGAAVYRDHGDDYLVRMKGMHPDVTRAQRFLNEQQPSGGGDFPEAVDEALEQVLDAEQWDPAARARILFLVLDAPPHQDEEGRLRLQTTVRRAARDGIQIIPVVGSGIDKPTEFLMRSIAISTNGRYVFLTDDSGVGGSHIDPTVGEHDVERLNDLLVRLIIDAAK